MGKLVDLTGERFGKLTVVGRSSQNKGNKRTYWDCVCECGNRAVIESWNLRNGLTKSCGCLFRDSITSHGGCHTPLYRVWMGMKARCQNPNSKAFKYYGGKGVSVCDEWLDFQSFMDWAIFSGYSNGLTLDRVDSQGNYCPENCRWITQSENSSRTARRFLTVNGETLGYSQWAEKLGINRVAIEHWIQRHGEDYAIRRIDATLNPQNFSPKEISALGIGKNVRKYATIGEETLSYSAWAKRIGMSHTNLLHILKTQGEKFAIARIKQELSKKP